MAAIVYEGMVGGEGELFAGIKFYLLQRVPMRSTWMDHITRNGGELVKLEKQADIVIADHAKSKDCPPGSISWTFIDKSVTKGRLENKEDHRAGPEAHVVREVGSRQLPRSGRTPFTAKDDHDLLLWVVKAERKGISVKGNDLYKQLETVNPRHTFQSWRDRWIKHLAHRPRPEISEEELSAVGTPSGSIYSNYLPPARSPRPPIPDNDDDSAAPVEEHARFSTSRPQIARPNRPSPKPNVSTKPKDEPVAAQTTKILPHVRTSTGGMDFTKEETDHMIEYFDVIADADQKMGVKAWAKKSAENPNHSAQEWHDYFVQTIKPLVEKQQQISKDIAATAENQPSSSRSRANASKRTDVGASHAADASETQIERQKFVDPSTKDEKMFKEDLSAMAEDTEVEVDFEPIICGRKIPLFRLWQVVASEEFGGYGEVSDKGLWLQVAEKLNFNKFRHAKAPEAIKAAYEEILPQFEEAREEYVAMLQDEAMIESQLRVTAERDSIDEEEVLYEEFDIVEEEEEEDDDSDDDLEAAPSVPRQPQPSSSSKRTFESDKINRNNSPLPGTSHKRQRTDKGEGSKTEIPCSPEDRINPNQTPRPTYKSSPLKYQQSAVKKDSANDDILTCPVKPLDLPKKQQGKRNLEPETQDFNFPSFDEDVEAQQSFSSLPNRRKEKNPIAAGDGSPHEDSSTQSQTAQELEEQLKAFVDRHVALGYSEDIVIAALESTTLTTGNAAIVMEALSSGKGIPADMQGVWTADDDAALEDVESGDFQRVLMKHGTKSVKLRQKYRGYLEEQ